jgi:hypothetical protein
MYLTPAEVRQKLISIGTYTVDTVPTLDQLTYLLEEIEERLDIWLGYHPGRKTYVEDYRSSQSGTVTLMQYPVIIVRRVEVYNNFDPSEPPMFVTENILSNWLQGTLLKVEYPGTAVKVVYDAGYDPLPRRFKMAAFALLRKCLENTGLTGDLSFLSEPIRDVSSISVPGISKSFRLGGSSNNGSGSSGGSVLDRQLASLVAAGDRRLYRLG